jgi:hypothetical protein
LMRPYMECGGRNGQRVVRTGEDGKVEVVEEGNENGESSGKSGRLSSASSSSITSTTNSVKMKSSSTSASSSSTWWRTQLPRVLLNAKFADTIHMGAPKPEQLERKSSQWARSNFLSRLRLFSPNGDQRNLRRDPAFSGDNEFRIIYDNDNFCRIMPIAKKDDSDGQDQVEIDRRRSLSQELDKIRKEQSSKSKSNNC